jgi:ABC-type Fe3+-hydroxamate transport system substrate-binding protein
VSKTASSACPVTRCGHPQVRREKPRVSAFTSADIPKILALEPDLVLTFSDLQAEIAAELIRGALPSMLSISATSPAFSQ